MKSFREFILDTDFEVYFDVSLIPDDFTNRIKGKQLMNIYSEYIGDNDLLKQKLIKAWMDYFSYYLSIKVDQDYQLFLR